MPINIIKKRNTLADAITSGTEGFLQGRELRQKNEDRSIANAYKNAQISELQRKAEALGQPAPEGYVRDPYSGNLIKNVSFMDPLQKAKFEEIQRRTKAINEPAPAGYFRDSYSGKLIEDLNYMPPALSGSGGGMPPLPGAGSSEGEAGESGAPLLKEYKVGKRTYTNPAYDKYKMDEKLRQKKAEYEMRPLSDTASSRLSAAEQSLGNLQTVRELATPERFEEMKRGFSKIRIGNKTGITNPESVSGTALKSIPVIGGFLPRMFKTTDDQKKFENNISTLVEAQLRSRTGAAAPQQEVDREVSRILASDDSLQSFLAKLSNAEKFAIGVADGIKPGTSRKYAGPPKKSNGGIDLSNMSEEELRALAGN